MVKKAPLGSDVAKAAEGYAMNRDMDHEEEGSAGHSPIVSFRDCFNKLCRELDTEGYQLIPSPIGRFCGHEVYVKSHLDVLGLKQPKSFYYYRKVRVEDIIDTTQFLSKVRSICEDNRTNETSKKEAGVWERMALAFDDLLSDPKSPIARIAQSNMSGADRRVTTLTGKPGYHKVVPPLDWFPQALQDYDPTDLLTLFPPAERSQLVLILGRLMAGANGTKTAEGVIEHTARAYGIIVGTSAGMGKSTFLNWLKETLETLGYTTGQLNANLSKFGWGEVATVDLATIDDLTDDVQRELLQNVHLKSIVSNCWLKVEEKGMPAVDIKATSVILGCTNVTNYSHYIGMDSGSLSRLNQLDTYTQDELAGVYPGTDARIKPYWEAKAAEFGCSPRLLMARLLRHALDQFLAVTGHSLDDRGLLVKNLKDDTLEVTMKTTRERFRIDCSLRHADELPHAISHLVSLTIAQANGMMKPMLVKNLSLLDFGPELLTVLMELFIAKAQYSQELSELRLLHLSYDCKKYIRSKLQDLKHLASTKSVEGAFQALVAELKSNKGFGYPQRSSHYQVQWMAAKRLVPGLVKDYEAKLANLQELDQAICSAVNQMQTLLTQVNQ